MERVSVAALLAALEGAPPSWLASDADGTLWSGDVGEDWLDALATTSLGPQLAHLPAVADAFALMPWVDASTLVHAARDAYRRGALVELDYFRFVAATLGPRPDDLRRPVREALEHACLSQRNLPESVELLRGLVARGHRLAVLSASPTVVVQEALSLAGIEPDATIGFEPDTQSDTHPRIAPYADGKRMLIDSLRGAAPLLVAMGDSTFDAAMLAGARVPLAVRPKEGLLRTAVPGLRLLSE